MAKTKSRLRSVLEVAIPALLLLACALFVFRHSVYEPPASAPQASAAPASPTAPAVRADAPEEAVVLSVTGPVQRAHANGAWAKLTAGERLKADESIRTGKGGSTDLRIGDRSRLMVTDSTQVTIRELTHAVHRFKLDRGRLAVDYKPDGERVLKIESEGSAAVAETTGARFSVLSSGSTVAVATETGSVNLRAAGHVVAIGEGQQAVARGDEAPGAPVFVAALPIKLLLKVAGADTQELCARVSGQADPGSEVLIDGVPAQVDEAGRFEVKVPRRPAEKKDVLVAMRDPLGREETRTVPCGALGEGNVDGLAIRWKKRKVAQ